MTFARFEAIVRICSLATGIDVVKFSNLLLVSMAFFARLPEEISFLRVVSKPCKLLPYPAHTIGKFRT